MRALILLLAACADVPETPSFQTDVLPILAANCVRCHGYPAIGGAPPEFRLDSYDEIEGVFGAAALASSIPPRLVDEAAPMPPRFPLDDDQIAILENWARDPVRGAARPGNRAPSVVIEDGLVRVEDPDGDLVTGTLRSGDFVVAPLRSGEQAIALPAGELVAHVDDGALVHVVTVQR